MTAVAWYSDAGDARIFRVRETVRFRHCDPAGIVFYPRYFEMINEFVEAWFDQALGASFHALHVEQGIGTPTASVQCDFVSPSRWNDVLVQHLHVVRLGGASVQLAFAFTGEDGRPRLTGTIAIVTVDLSTLRSRRLPDALRQAMSAFLIDDAPGGAASSTDDL